MERLNSGNQKVRNYPFLMGQGVWLDSDKLDMEDSVGEVLKHGTLSLGFIGLAECLKALIGKHHGESEQAQKLGLDIIGYMRRFADKNGQKRPALTTPSSPPRRRGLSGRFVRIDKEKFGVIPGVTDRDYYTNSFHVPVYYDISAFDKIRLEAPLPSADQRRPHLLCGAGAGRRRVQQPEAFETVVRFMKESGVGYGLHQPPGGPGSGLRLYRRHRRRLCPGADAGRVRASAWKKLSELGVRNI